MARKAKRDDSNPMEMNLTPMIDCTFQLIIFFILTTRMTSEQLASLIPPDPVDSKAKEREGSEHKTVVIVNVYNKYGDKEDQREGDFLEPMRATGYKIGQETIQIGEEARITEILKERKQRHLNKGGSEQDIYIEVRADKDIGYDQILPVMEAASQAVIGEMYMTALCDSN